MIQRGGVVLTLATTLSAPLASVAAASGAAPVLRLASMHPAATLSWSAPTGSVAGYVVMESSNATRFAIVARVTDVTSFEPRHLRNGATYEFLVIAELGGGGVSAASNIVMYTPIGAPGVPRGVRALAQPRAAMVTWYAPASDGGSAITRYVVTASPGVARCTERVSAPHLGAEIPSPAQHCRVGGLRDGVRYRFRVVAVNRWGGGSASPWSAATKPEEIPLVPRGVVAQPLDSSALVTWNAPAGGVRPTSFVVTAQPGGATCTSHTTSCTVSALTNGVDYTFSVVASSVVGTSASSAPSSPVQPSTVISVTVGPFSAGSSVLSTDALTQVQSLANAVQFSGATFVTLVGGAPTASSGLAEAQSVASQLKSDLTTLGVSGITVIATGSAGETTLTVLANVS